MERLTDRDTTEREVKKLIKAKYKQERNRPFEVLLPERVLETQKQREKEETHKETQRHEDAQRDRKTS